MNKTSEDTDNNSGIGERVINDDSDKGKTQGLEAMFMNFQSQLEDIHRKLQGKRNHDETLIKDGEPTKRHRTESSCTKEEDSDIEDLLSSPKKVSDAEHTDRPDHDEILLDIEQEYLEGDSTGPPIKSRLANIINKRFASLLSTDKMKEKETKYDRPENCDKLVVPAVNTEIFRKLSHSQKQRDVRFQSIQRAITKSAIAISELTEALLSSKNGNKSVDYNELIRKSTDAIAFMGHASVGLSYRRRDLLHPALPSNVARQLCSADVEITNNLFGDDLAKTIRNIREANIATSTYIPRGDGASKNGKRFTQTSRYNNKNHKSNNRNPFPNRKYKKHQQ